MHQCELSLPSGGCGPCDNARIAEIARDLIGALARVYMLLVTPWKPEALPRTLQQHQMIIDAIQAHDVDLAYQHALKHVEFSSHSLKEAHAGFNPHEDGRRDESR